MNPSLRVFYHRVVHIDAQINDFDGPLQFSSTKCSLHPKVRERMKEKALEIPSTPSIDLDPHIDLIKLTQPTALKKKDTSNKKRSTSKKERATCAKRQIHDEDAIGVDEEGMYSDTDSLVALSDSICDTDLVASSDSDFDSCDFEYDPDVDIVDDEEDIHAFSYDVDDPCIEVGVVFPDVKQCKEDVTQHAIIHNHAFKPTITDHNKFRL
jgi:hypothetical protein